MVFFLLCLFVSFPIISGDIDLPEVILPAVSSDKDIVDIDDADNDLDVQQPEDILPPVSKIKSSDEDDEANENDTGSAPMVPTQETAQELMKSSDVADDKKPASQDTLDIQEIQLPEVAPSALVQTKDKPQADEDDDKSTAPAMHEVHPLEDIPSPEDSEEGIDTVDLQDPSGNWLYKRIWWEKAESRYDKIKASVNRVLDSRMQFFKQRVNLDRSLFDPFYMSLGLTRGELQEAVSYIIEQLQGVPSGDRSVEQQKQSMINTLQAEQKNVERLQSNVETISKIDHAIDDALTKLMNQINLCRNYEQEGWQYLRSIAQELSDKAARDHYYAMDTLWKNVKNIQQYIDGEFSAHFNELVNEAQKQTESITRTINQLKEKGIDLKKMVQGMLEQEDVERDEDRDEDDEDEQAPVGWFSWFVNILLWPFHKIAELWHYFFG